MQRNCPGIRETKVPWERRISLRRAVWFAAFIWPFSSKPLAALAMTLGISLPYPEELKELLHRMGASDDHLRCLAAQEPELARRLSNEKWTEAMQALSLLATKPTEELGPKARPAT